MKNCNINNEFQRFLSENQDIINEITPVVTSISRDDEWAKEDEWDELYEHLTTKEGQNG